MAIQHASDLDYPLVDAVTREPVTEWDDDYYGLEYVEMVKPDRLNLLGQPYTDPLTGETKIKTDWEDDDLEPMYLLHQYNEQEIQRKQELNEMQAWQDRLNSSPDRLDEVEETQASADEALCDLYEQLLSAQDTISAQDDAVCELYELILGEV